MPPETRCHSIRPTILRAWMPLWNRSSASCSGTTISTGTAALAASRRWSGTTEGSGDPNPVPAALRRSEGPKPAPLEQGHPRLAPGWGGPSQPGDGAPGLNRKLFETATMLTDTRGSIGTAVRDKNVAQLTDSRLMYGARAKLVESAADASIKLRRGDARTGLRVNRYAERYVHARQYKRMRRVIKCPRTIVGRVLCDIDRGPNRIRWPIFPRPSTASGRD